MWAAQVVGGRRATKAAFQSPHLQHVVALRHAMAAKQRPPLSTNQIPDAPRRLRLPPTTTTSLPATTTLARLRRLVGMVARRSVARYLCDGVHSYLRRCLAARRLQRVYRRHRQCRLENGATSLQRLYRGHQGRRVALLRCQMRAKLLAAVRRHVLHRRWIKHQQVCAVNTLARTWRRYCTHRRKSAAMVLQAMVRRSQQRQALAARSHRWQRAWVPFQALFRRHVASVRFESLRRGVVALQRRVRCHRQPAVPVDSSHILSERCHGAILTVTDPPPVKVAAKRSTPRATVGIPGNNAAPIEDMSSSNDVNLCNGTGATPRLAGPENQGGDAGYVEEDLPSPTSMAFAAPSSNLLLVSASTAQPMHAYVPQLCLSRLTSASPAPVVNAAGPTFSQVTVVLSQATVAPTPPKVTLHLPRAAPSHQVATKHVRTTAVTSNARPVVWKQHVSASIQQSPATPAACLAAALRHLVARRRYRRHRAARQIQRHLRRWLAFLAVQHLRLNAIQRLRAALAADLDAECIWPRDDHTAPPPAPPSLYALNRHQLPFGCVYRAPPPLWTWSHGKWRSTIVSEWQANL